MHTLLLLLLLLLLHIPRSVCPQIAGTMQQFEKQFENLDLQTQVVDGVMSQQAALSTPEDEVGALMQQVADEHGLELQIGLPGASTSIAAAAQAAPEADLTSRLAELKGR
jgi:charged multivesicular body protein 1